MYDYITNFRLTFNEAGGTLSGKGHAQGEHLCACSGFQVDTCGQQTQSQVLSTFSPDIRAQWPGMKVLSRVWCCTRAQKMDGVWGISRPVWGSSYLLPCSAESQETGLRILPGRRYFTHGIFFPNFSGRKPERWRGCHSHLFHPPCLQSFLLPLRFHGVI